MDDEIKEQEAPEPDGVPDDPDASFEDDDELPTVKGQPMGPRLAAGEVLLGRYEVVGSLGRGAMGVVLRCLDRVSAIDVAVKALPPELSHNAAEMADIRANFQLIHHLHHPHIAGINVLDRDSATAYYFLIMEYVDGVSLDKHRKQRGGTLSLEETSRIIQQVAGALDYAHSKKVIHRDIKPANIMVLPDGSAKVLDFGIAAQLHSSMTRVSRHRYSSSGTAPYMAPEQWEGEFQNESTDQYALAVTAYEMLAGRRPFGSHDLKVMMASVLYKDAARIEGLPRSAWAALRKALAKDRRRRFDTCTDFADALAGQAPVSSGLSRWMRIVAAVLMLVSLTCFGAVIYRLHRSKRTAELAQKKAADELDAMRRRELARKHVSLGDIYREAQQFSDALKSYRLAEQSDPSFPGLAERIARANAVVATQETARKKTQEETEKLRREALTMVSDAVVLRDAGKLDEAETKYMAALKLMPGDAEIAQAVQAVRKDIEARRKAAEEERKRIAAARKLARELAGQADALHKAGSLSEALAKYQEALKNAPDDQAIKAAILSVLGDIQARKKEAEALKRRVDGLFAEVEKLKGEKRFDAALAKCKDIQMVAPDYPGLKTCIDELEQAIAEAAKVAKERERKRQLVVRAGALVAAGKSLLRENDLVGALAKYEEARAVLPDYPGLEAAIVSLNKAITAQALAKQEALARQQAALREKEKRAAHDRAVTRTRERVESMMAHADDLCKNGNAEAGITKYVAAAAICRDYPELKSLSEDIKKRMKEAQETEKKKVRRPRAH